MSRTSLRLLRWSAFALACLFLYLRFADDPAWIGQAQWRALLADPRLFGTLGAVAALMLVNWGLESGKWRILVRDLEPLSRGRAFLATLAGTPIGLATPNRAGEFAGRVLFLAPEHRIPGSLATVLGGVAQFVVTVVLGLLGAVALLGRDGRAPLPLLWAALCAAAAAASLLLYFNPGMVRAAMARIPLVRRWERHAAVLEGYSPALLRQVLLLSAVRYLVFALQFALLLRAFAGLSWADAALPVPAAFLLATLIPTETLTELGVRGSVAVALISPGPEQDEAVFLASAALWAINLALPALIGGLILLRARVRTAHP